jgi:hypothetical protein
MMPAALAPVPVVSSPSPLAPTMDARDWVPNAALWVDPNRGERHDSGGTGALCACFAKASEAVPSEAPLRGKGG